MSEPVADQQATEPAVEPETTVEPAPVVEQRMPDDGPLRAVVERQDRVIADLTERLDRVQRAETARLVDAAVTDGRIDETDRERWTALLDSPAREQATEVLAAMRPLGGLMTEIGVSGRPPVSAHADVDSHLRRIGHSTAQIDAMRERQNGAQR